jgi:hypothetical protein
VADDRGVDQDVERFGGERTERRQRQPQDLPVVPGSKGDAEDRGT